MYKYPNVRTRVRTYIQTYIARFYRFTLLSRRLYGTYVRGIRITFNYVRHLTLASGCINFALLLNSWAHGVFPLSLLPRDTFFRVIKKDLTNSFIRISTWEFPLEEISIYRTFNEKSFKISLSAFFIAFLYEHLLIDEIYS